MLIYLCSMTLHENLFYATRELGRLYESGRYLHNYALTYALGLAAAPYFHAQQRPRYAEQLQPLNKRGVYVTPARGVNIAYELNTFKYANNDYHVEMKQGTKNTPSYGRAKELATGSVFRFGVLSDHDMLSLPTWIRMGLWRSKARLEWDVLEAKLVSDVSAVSSLPLNPLDIEPALSSFDLISMPPSSLVDHATLHTNWWTADHDDIGRIRLPAGMQYRFPDSAQ